MLVKGLVLVFVVGITAGRHLTKSKYQAHSVQGFSTNDIEKELALLETLLKRAETEEESTQPVQPVETENPPNPTEQTKTSEPHPEPTDSESTASYEVTTEYAEATTEYPETTTEYPEDATRDSTPPRVVSEGPTTIPAAMTEEEAYEIVQKAMDSIFLEPNEHQEWMKKIVREIPRDTLNQVIGDFSLVLLEEAAYCKDRVLLDVIAGGVELFSTEESSPDDETNLRYKLETYIVDNQFSPDFFGMPVANFSKEIVDVVFKPVLDFFKNHVEPTIGLKSRVMFSKVLTLLRGEPTPDMELQDLLKDIGVAAVLAMQSQVYENCDQVLTPDVRLYLKEEAVLADIEFKAAMHEANLEQVIRDISPTLSTETITALLDHLKSTTYLESIIQEMEQFLTEFESTEGSLASKLVYIAQETFRKFLVFEIEEDLMEKLARIVRVVVEEEIGKCGLFSDVPVGTINEQQMETILTLTFERVLREGTAECMDTVLVRMLAGYVQYREYYVNYDFKYFTTLFEQLEEDLQHVSPRTTRLAILVFRLVKEMFADHLAVFYKELESLVGRSMSEMYYYNLERLGDPENKDMALDLYVEEVVKYALHAAEVESMEVCHAGDDLYPDVVQMINKVVESARSLEYEKIESIVKHSLQLFDATALQEITETVRGRLEAIFQEEIGEMANYGSEVETEGQTGLLSRITMDTIAILAGANTNGR